MQPFPETPPADDVPESGHLWLLEAVDGLPLRFALDDAGTLGFAAEQRPFDPWDEPMAYRHAARHVREAFDVDALRAAADAPDEYVFYGVATTRQGVDYDWPRTPSFLLADVWDGEAYLPPDVVAGGAERLGLSSLPAVEKELPARDFHPDRFAVPDSAFHDGPAAGVVVRDKTGYRGRIDGPTDGSPDVDPTDAVDLAASVVTEARIRLVVDALSTDGAPPSTDAVLDRLAEAAARERHPWLPTDPDWRAFRSAAAERVARVLD